MEKLAIQGGRPLTGRLRIHGSKNAALPILAATVLAEGQYSIQDVPHLTDISVMMKILTSLGASAKHEHSQMFMDTSSLASSHIPKDLMGQMRSSIFLMGPLLARFGEVIVYPPGGCAIGQRKIDLHLKGLTALGAEIKVGRDHIRCQANRLEGAEIPLAYPSVGATENIMMAAVQAKGKTIIRNAAREPEIVDLQNFLNTMGAKVSGAGSSIIEIEGVSRLKAVDYRVIPDRIVAGTIILAAAMTRGSLTIENITPHHIQPLIDIVKLCGVEIEQTRDIMKVSARELNHAVDCLETGPYPDFPTDMQAQLMAFLSLAKGQSVIRENVFDGRFKHVPQLRKLGANIKTHDNEAFIYGGIAFHGTDVEATDLRAGAALILAGLAGSGVTTIHQVHHIDRGYEKIEEQLQSIGAFIKRIRD